MQTVIDWFMSLPVCGTLVDWIVAVGTLGVAVVAVFQETIRGWFYRPKFSASIKTEPPDCVSVPIAETFSGKVLADSIYLRLWVENAGNASAKNVEVYAKELRRERADHTWERVKEFPPMNLKWSNTSGVVFFPSIAPNMGKHCDIAHIVDPARRQFVSGAENPKLNLTNQQTSLIFDLVAQPNHKGHIVARGEYKLDILIAADNVRPVKRTITISLKGVWDADETKMLRDGVGTSIGTG